MSIFRGGLMPFLCLVLLFVSTASQTSPVAEGAGFRAAIASESRRPMAARLPRSAFLQPSNLADVQLSPQGLSLAYLRRAASGQSLWLLDTIGGEPRQVIRHSEATSLRWSADGRWLFLESARQLFALSMSSEPGSGVMTLFGGRQRRRLLAADPDSPASILVTEEMRSPVALRPSGYRLLRLTPGRVAQTVFQGHREIAGFVHGTSDADAFVKLVDGDGFTIQRVDANGTAHEVMRCVRLEHCDLLSSPAPGELLLDTDAGGNLERIVRIDRAGTTHLVHQDPAGQADLAEVTLDPASRQPLLATYRSIASAVYPLAADMRPSIETIRRALRTGDFGVIVGRGRGARWLISQRGDQLQHPRWHLYDPASGTLREILADVEAGTRRVPVQSAARRIAVSYRASDGFLLHGFVAVPPGVDPRRAPLVVQVHGGPWSHVSAGYSTITQFLVNRGYAVFEPNFRGSTGHGRAYRFASGDDLGNGRVQQDVVEGTRFLLSMGVGDPARVGITGISFGGYSSLLGVTFAPDLFRVAVAAMPPTDFGWILRWQLAREEARGLTGTGLGTSLRAMGIVFARPRFASRLHSQSPLSNAAFLRRPVLLVAGGRDESVPLRSVLSYAARLSAQGSDVTLFVDPHSGHQIEAPVAQEQYLYLMERMLGANLSVPYSARPGGEAGRKLARNLRLPGRSFARPWAARRVEPGQWN